MIESALDNCNRSIIIWSLKKASGWQIAEMMAMRNQFAKRVPVNEPSEFFLILRNTDKHPGDEVIPLFQFSEYVNYSARAVREASRGQEYR
ncbi:MAG: hypothetical protein ACC660_00615, partial [Acidimicrobiales bacterium]